MTALEKLRAGEYETKLPYPPNQGKTRSESAIRRRRNARMAWREDSNRLCDEFKMDLLEERGLADHPKADHFYEIA